MGCDWNSIAPEDILAHLKGVGSTVCTGRPFRSQFWNHFIGLWIIVGQAKKELFNDLNGRRILGQPWIQSWDSAHLRQAQSFCDVLGGDNRSGEQQQPTKQAKSSTNSSKQHGNLHWNRDDYDEEQSHKVTHHGSGKQV